VVIPAKEISDYLTKGGHPDGADPGCAPAHADGFGCQPRQLCIGSVRARVIPGADQVGIFFGLVVTLTGVRAAGWRCYYHNQKTEGAPGKWALFATAGSGLSGLLWGLGSTLLLPDNIVEQTFRRRVRTGGPRAGESSLRHSPAAGSERIKSSLLRPIARNYAA